MSKCSYFYCAQGGTRTLTPLPEHDFESCASTSSATRAKNKLLNVATRAYSILNITRLTKNVKSWSLSNSR